MNFNSLHFALFYAVVFPVFFATPARFRWLLLLVSSYYFYAQWNVAYLPLLVYVSACAYSAGLLLVTLRGRRRKALLVVTLALLLVPLLVFKYGNFLVTSLHDGLAIVGISHTIAVPALLLPIGISFFSFQAIAYVLDVYRNHACAERHPGLFALYIAFFPQLVAGPIERAEHILPQFRKPYRFDRALASSGLRLALWGLFKKMVVADRVAEIIEPIFADPHAYDGVRFLFAGAAFGVQIYCDFSAYSDIAVGVSRVLGISLMRNFRNPYLANSLREFWQRWHISLSTWFRDYLYVPLGGSRVGKYRWAGNILLVFLISGLWHGAAWTFALWGALHGLGLVLERGARAVFRRFTQRHIPALLAIPCTFGTVSLLWLLFRAASLKDALYMLTHIHTGWHTQLLHAVAEKNPWQFLGLDPFLLNLAAAGIAVTVAVEWIIWPSKACRRRTVPKWLRWCGYLCLVEAILLLGVHGNDNPFIYFQF